MKFAIIGCGSIGKRHIKNLLSLNHKVAAWNRGEKRRKEVKKLFDIQTFSKQEELYNKFKPDVVFICTPNIDHTKDALLAAKNKCSIFIEKPLASNLKDLSKLKKIIINSKINTHIACNMRFDFGPKKIKELLNSKTLGKILWSNFFVGTYLPKWHPNEDYKKMYSSLTSLGGGVILDCIHEIDLLLWYFNAPTKYYSIMKNTKTLNIQTEDIADFIFHFKSGLIASMHMDYLYYPPKRSIKILGQKGWAEWDIATNDVKMYLNSSKKIKIFKSKKNYNKNLMYIDQIKYFIDCIKKNKKSFSSFEDGFNALNLVMKLKNKNILK